MKSFAHTSSFSGNGLRALCIVLLGLSGCAETGETTKVGAVTGGVLGAGLGALVGSQTGSAGGGLAIGALAGASGGAIVGKEIDEQKSTIRAQDEAIERQQHLITAQSAEIAEVKRMQDRGSLAPNLKTSRGDRIRLNPPLKEDSRAARFSSQSSNTRQGFASSTPMRIPRETVKAKSKLSERTLIAPEVDSDSDIATQQIAPSRARAQIAEVPARLDPKIETKSTITRTVNVGAEPDAIEKLDEVDDITDLSEESASELTEVSKPEKVARLMAVPPVANSEDCRKADEEVSKATKETENADRLFHLRRALRLCPGRAEFHNQLGEVYLGLNRKADAEFEFREAIKLNPQLEVAKQNLSTVRQ